MPEYEMIAHQPLKYQAIYNKRSKKTQVCICDNHEVYLKFNMKNGKLNTLNAANSCIHTKIS
jgi:hypothetical protein